MTQLLADLWHEAENLLPINQVIWLLGVATFVTMFVLAIRFVVHEAWLAWRYVDEED